MIIENASDPTLNRLDDIQITSVFRVPGHVVVQVETPHMEWTSNIYLSLEEFDRIATLRHLPPGDRA